MRKIATDWQGIVAGLIGVLTLLGPLRGNAGEPATTDEFCIRVQQLLAGTTLRPDQNVVYTDYAAFRASKTAVRPLTTHQYSMPEPGTANSPMRISCKVKTPDHLNAEYGPGTATDRGLTCADVNRDTARRVYAGLTPGELAVVRVPQARIAFDPDESTFMGSGFVGEFPFAYTGTDGQLHLHAKSLRVDWDNVWFSWAPNRLRGAYYCHLVAPEYLRRLALGTATAPPKLKGD